MGCAVIHHWQPTGKLETLVFSLYLSLSLRAKGGGDQISIEQEAWDILGPMRPAPSPTAPTGPPLALRFDPTQVAHISARCNQVLTRNGVCKSRLRPAGMQTTTSLPPAKPWAAIGAGAGRGGPFDSSRGHDSPPIPPSVPGVGR